MWREGGEREGGCDHTEAGWSKAIRDLVFFFPPSSSMEGAEVLAEPQTGGELHRKRRRGQEGSRGKEETVVIHDNFFYSTYTLPQPIFCAILSI